MHRYHLIRGTVKVTVKNDGWNMLKSAKCYSLINGYIGISVSFLIIFTTLFFLYSSVLGATTFYVYKYGINHLNCGQIDNECASIQYVLDNRVSPGDVIKVKQEDYSVGHGINFNASTQENITLTADDAQNPPTLQGDNSNWVIRIAPIVTNVTVANLKIVNQPPGTNVSSRSGAVQIYADHTTIDHCEIVKAYTGIEVLAGKNINITNNIIHTMGRAGLGNCIRIGSTSASNWSQEIKIVNNTVHHCAEAGIKVVNAQFVKIDGNNFHDNKNGLDFRSVQNLKIQDNTFRNNRHHGIQSDYYFSTYNVAIRSNRVLDNDIMGIMIRGSIQSNWKIYNNLIYNNCKNPPSSAACFGANLGSSGAEFLHNVVYNHPDGSIEGGSSIKNNVFYLNGPNDSSGNNGAGGSHNYVFPTTGDLGSSPVTDSDPHFTSAATGDFTLQPGSPLIDAGIDTGIDKDFAGNPRPVGAYDIGAFEYQSGQIDTPSSPSSFRIITIE